MPRSDARHPKCPPRNGGEQGGDNQGLQDAATEEAACGEGLHQEDRSRQAAGDSGGPALAEGEAEAQGE